MRAVGLAVLKLGVRDRIQALIYSYEAGLVRLGLEYCAARTRRATVEPTPANANSVARPGREPRGA